MLNITNKLARSSWKYHYYANEEVESYITHLLDIPNNNYNYRRYTTLTQLNYFKPAVIYTGKYTIERFFLKYHFGFKVGGFSKNRKPYYFRSKKKNVKKKYTI